MVKFIKESFLLVIVLISCKWKNPIVLLLREPE